MQLLRYMAQTNAQELRDLATALSPGHTEGPGLEHKQLRSIS